MGQVKVEKRLHLLSQHPAFAEEMRKVKFSDYIGEKTGKKSAKGVSFLL
jgi:hypothetical protein